MVIDVQVLTVMEEYHHADILKAIYQIKETYILIVMGDMNANIGKGNVADVVGEYELGERNARGDRLLHYATKLNQYFFPPCLTTDFKRFLRVDHEFGIKKIFCNTNFEIFAVFPRIGRFLRVYKNKI